MNCEERSPSGFAQGCRIKWREDGCTESGQRQHLMGDLPWALWSPTGHTVIISTLWNSKDLLEERQKLGSGSTAAL